MKSLLIAVLVLCCTLVRAEETIYTAYVQNQEERYSVIDDELIRIHDFHCNAAKYGNPDSQYKLGLMYANGYGVKKDNSIAIELFKLSADRGNQSAISVLETFKTLESSKLPDCMMPAQLPMPVVPAANEVITVKAPSKIIELVKRLAPQYSIDVNLALAMIFTESGFNPLARSPAHAMGLMQLIPKTASRFGVTKPFNPDDNVRGGLSYIRWLLAFFEGNVPLALAGYNAGEHAVERYRGIPPYRETRNYVNKILNLYNGLTHPFDPDVTRASSVIKQIRK